jgi:hypothetical protein
MAFYGICLADPTNPVYAARAKRFAGFYLNDDPDVQNYDFEHKIIKCSHNGSHGPCYEHWRGDGVFAGDTYGIPYYDIPGVKSVHDLHTTLGAMKKMGEIAKKRASHGDVAVNLAATSLVANAYLFTGDAKYKSWVKDYVDVWRGRIKDNNGIIPDNVGPSGKIGECSDGRWYGGTYGWTFPHGWESIGDALTIADQNATVLTGDASYMDMLRSQLDLLAGLGIKKNGILNVPHKHTDPGAGPVYHPEDWKGIMHDRQGNIVEVNGWFEFMPLHPMIPTALWYMTMDSADLARLDRLKDYKRDTWDVLPTNWWYHKDQSGLQYPWIAYLRGRLPDFPERALQYSLEKVEGRYAKIVRDRHARKTLDLLGRNPIVTEALLQLTMGAPQPVYNGALLNARVRHFDWQRKRPGLPKDVGALVEKLEGERTVLQLVNLNPTEAREMVVQAGGLGEHLFTTVKYRARINGKTSEHKLEVNDKYLFVHLDPASTVTIDAGMKRYVGNPSYKLPWKQ